MNSLIYYQEKNLRIAGSQDQPMFCAKDVCDLLGIKHVSQAVRDIPARHKGMYEVHTLKGLQQMLFVTEPGFYKLIFVSRKEEALVIQDWVFEEVLPSIRKHGYYRAGREDVPAELKALPAGRRDFIMLWIDICNEIAASPRRMAKVKELADRFKGKRGFKETNILRRFYAWCHAKGDWRVLDRWSSLYRYPDALAAPKPKMPPPGAMIIES